MEEKQKSRFKEILEGIFLIIEIDIYLAFLFILPIIAYNFFNSKIIFILTYLVWFLLIIIGWNYEVKVR